MISPENAFLEFRARRRTKANSGVIIISPCVSVVNAANRSMPHSSLSSSPGSSRDCRQLSLGWESDQRILLPPGRGQSECPGQGRRIDRMDVQDRLREKDEPEPAGESHHGYHGIRGSPDP